MSDEQERLAMAAQCEAALAVLAAPDGMRPIWIEELRYDVSKYISDLESQLAATQQRLAECEADAGRLDWLDRNLGMKTGWRVGVAKAGSIVVFSVGLSKTAIREAIDEAMGRG